MADKVRRFLALGMGELVSRLTFPLRPAMAKEHRTLKNSPPDAVPGLDVQPLREHAWLDSLDDAGVVTDASVYDRLARDSAPFHPPPIVDLGSDNDSVASMDETGPIPSTSGRDPIFRPNEITIGESSGGPRGADRNAGRGGRTVGRTAHPVGLTQGRAPDRGEKTPSRSVVQFPVNRGGGSTSRRRPRESEVEGPQKHQIVEVNSAEVVATGFRFSTTSPVRESIVALRSSPPSNVESMGAALGSSSSVCQRIYEILREPSFLSDRGPGIYSWPEEWIETTEVPFVLLSRLLSLAENTELSVKDLDAARDAALCLVNQLQVDLKAEQAAKSEANKELVDLRLKAKELEEVKAKKDELDPALMAAQDGTTAIVENAKVDVGHLTLAAFNKSEEFVGLLGERYDGGWVAAKRCVCHSHPSFDWERMETAFAEGVHLRPLADKPYICSEEVIANILPVAEDEEVPPS
ncbi:hypothetical protein BVRB_6g140630 [Beta vulgaris subsp. vulgaris]|nr:hypothetical protein BVRB_6g140630 [Beta vulgaris subsp. vulgaris]